MDISVEISLYPLDKKYIIRIDEFIKRLNGYDSIEVRTNPMSTQIFGDYEIIMKILKTEIRNTFNKKVESVFNLKIINIDSRNFDQKNLFIKT